MRYARVIDGKAVEVFENGDFNLTECFVPQLAEQFSPVPEQVETGWIRADDGTWGAPATATPEPTNPEPVPRHVSVLAFRQRFTAEEKTAIDLASLDDPQASLDQRAQAANLRVYQQDLQAAGFVDLDSSEIRDAVLLMESMGLLDTGRAAQILDTPPSDDELP